MLPPSKILTIISYSHELSHRHICSSEVKWKCPHYVWRYNKVDYFGLKSHVNNATVSIYKWCQEYMLLHVLQEPRV